ncbi:MAG: ABC transporter ATP-binding protein [Ardenticatenales bacterium]|nr:ABC transporter ATP-binding protein [Ardenticatenales bacterium]
MAQAAPPLNTVPSTLLHGPIIQAEGLTKKFGEQFAVQDITFQIPRGSIFGFIGPSGCGKTTTVRLLTGIYTPTGGDALVLGHRPTTFTQSTREQIGYMPQQFVLYPELTVWENLNFAASLYGMGRERKQRMTELLAFMELSEDKNKLVRQISGGMQRRLSLASTLLHDPELLFLDEPTAGLDPVLRRKVWDHFNVLKAEGRTLFVTTQYVGEAAYCDYVGMMAEGRLLMVETPEGLRRRAFGGEVIDLSLVEPISYEHHIRPLAALPFIQNQRVIRTGEKELRLIVDEASTAMPALMEWSQTQNLTIERMEEFLPPFDDVFVEIIKAVQKEPTRA